MADDEEDDDDDDETWLLPALNSTSTFLLRGEGKGTNSTTRSLSRFVRELLLPLLLLLLCSDVSLRVEESDSVRERERVEGGGDDADDDLYAAEYFVWSTTTLRHTRLGGGIRNTGGGSLLLRVFSLLLRVCEVVVLVAVVVVVGSIPLSSGSNILIMLVFRVGSSGGLSM